MIYIIRNVETDKVLCVDNLNEYDIELWERPLTFGGAITLKNVTKAFEAFLAAGAQQSIGFDVEQNIRIDVNSDSLRQVLYRVFSHL